jgi:hypothetical protein
MPWEKGPTPEPNATLTPLGKGLPKAAFGNLREAVSSVLLHVVFAIKLVVVEGRHKINSLLLDVTVFKSDPMFNRLDTYV